MRTNAVGSSLRGAARSALIVVCFGAATFVNPSVACGPSNDEPEWQYDEADMQQAILGTYEGSVSNDAGQAQTVTITIRQVVQGTTQTATSSRIQCGNRTFFVRPAGACASMTFMPVEATITSTASGIPSSHATGEVMAALNLESSQIDLTTDGGGHIFASYSDGAMREWTYSDANTSIALELTRTSGP